MFKKGKSGNPNGRPKGSKNKATTSVRVWLAQLIDDNREQLAKDFKNLSAKDRLAMLDKFLQYLIPKQSTTGVDFNTLSDAQVDDVINQLMKKDNED